MPQIPIEFLSSLLDQLRGQAQPRPDLITPGSTGSLENARPVTYLGRMVLPGESSQDVLKRFPQGEVEQGGLAMQAPDLLKAIIPLSFWRRAPSQVKASLTYALNDQPELMKRVLESDVKFIPRPELKPGKLGSSERITPNVNEIYIRPPSGGGYSKVPSIRERELAGVGAHELTHGLSNERVLGTDPVDAATIGTLLRETLTNESPFTNRASLNRVTRDIQAMSPEAVPAFVLAQSGGRGNPSSLAQLANAMTRYGSSAGPRMTMKDAYSRLAMDEGLATLAEAASHPQSSKLIQLLAERLGLGVTPGRKY